MPIYDYSLLLGRIREQRRTQRDVARAANMSPTTFNQKINGKREFRQSEIMDICSFLGIKDMEPYFFSRKIKVI